MLYTFHMYSYSLICCIDNLCALVFTVKLISKIYIIELHTHKYSMRILGELLSQTIMVNDFCGFFPLWSEVTINIGKIYLMS